MKIKQVLLEEGLGGYYFDDLEAIKEGAIQDGLFYIGKSKTPGFSSIRQAGQSILIILILENGQLALGDSVAVQYSGVAGRDPVLIPTRYIPGLRKILKKELIGKEINNFKDTSGFIESIKINGQKLHTGIRYGLSQAILDALAKINNKTIAEIIAEEYNLTISDNIIPIFLQTGEDRYIGVDKMILKRAPVMPHGLFNDVRLIGKKGEKLLSYLQWLMDRIRKYGDSNYIPIIHLDLYGTLGDIFHNNINEIATYLSKLRKTVNPFELRVEGPILMKNKKEMIDIYRKLKNFLTERHIDVGIVVNEFCNTLEDTKEFVDSKAVNMIAVKAPDLGSLQKTIEAIIYCKNHNVKAFLAGTCNSTDIAARVVAQVAMATNADQITGRPGMGIDEAMQITYNEMKRTLAIINNKLRNNIIY